MNEKPQVYHCAECEWRSIRNVGVCPICHGTLEPVASVTPQPATSSSTFSLTTLFLVLTLICVSVGAVVSAPGLGIPFVIISALALVRTWSGLSTSASGGTSSNVGDRIAHFIGSFGIIAVIFVAGVIAFQIACWASCFGVMIIGGEQTAFTVGIGFGGLVGLLAIAYLLYKTWPRKK